MVEWTQVSFVQVWDGGSNEVNFGHVNFWDTCGYVQPAIRCLDLQLEEEAKVKQVGLQVVVYKQG